MWKNICQGIRSPYPSQYVTTFSKQRQNEITLWVRRIFNNLGSSDLRGVFNLNLTVSNSIDRYTYITYLPHTIRIPSWHNGPYLFHFEYERWKEEEQKLGGGETGWREGGGERERRIERGRERKSSVKYFRNSLGYTRIPVAMETADRIKRCVNISTLNRMYWKLKARAFNTYT